MRWLLLFLMATQGFAATYYVRTDGNDSNTGTANTSGGAWLTVSKAASTLVAGDTVVIADGRYTGNVTETTSGVTYTGTTNAWIDGQFTLSGADYVTIDSLRIGVTNHVYNGGYGHIELDGGACSNNILNCLFDGGALGGGASVAGHGSAVYWYNGANNYNTVSNCVVRRVNYTKGIFRTHGTGALLVSNNVATTYDCDFLYLFGTNVTVRGNDVSGNVIVDPDAQHSDFFQTFGDNAGDVCINAVIEKNFMHDSQVQICFMSTDVATTNELHDIMIRNNVFANVTSFVGVGVMNTKLYNNVFYKVNTDGLGGGNQSVVYFGGSSAYVNTGFESVNNVFAECGGTPSSSTSGVGYTTNNGVAVQWGTLGHRNNYYGGTSGSTKMLPADGEATAVNGGTCDFLGAGSGNFHVGPSSVLINAGYDLSAVFTTDKDGTTRSAPWDIGAYEYVSGGGASVTTLNVGTLNLR